MFRTRLEGCIWQQKRILRKIFSRSFGDASWWLPQWPTIRAECSCAFWSWVVNNCITLSMVFFKFCGILFFIRWFSLCGTDCWIFGSLDGEKKSRLAKRISRRKGICSGPTKCQKIRVQRLPSRVWTKKAAWAPFHSGKTHTGVVRGPEHISTFLMSEKYKKKLLWG